MKGPANRVLIGLIGLVVLLLGANLVVILATGQSPVGPETLEWALLGVVTLAAVALAVAGVRFTTKARRNRNRSSYLWARRGFVTALAVTLALLADAITGDPVLLRGSTRLDAAIMIALVAGGPAFFAVASHREYLRTRGASGSGERRQ